MVHTTTLGNLRGRGQFVIGVLCWAAVAGFLMASAGWLLIFYHYGLALAERLRLSSPPSWTCLYNPSHSASSPPG